MLDAETRRCLVCRDLLSSNTDICPTCDRLAVPSHTLWPDHLKRWLLMRAVLDHLEAVQPRLAQSLWTRLLRTVIGRNTKWAATPHEQYLAAYREAQKWEGAGSPNLLGELYPTD